MRQPLSYNNLRLSQHQLPVLFRRPHLAHGRQGGSLPGKDLLRQGHHVLPCDTVVGVEDLLRGQNFPGKEQRPPCMAHTGLGGFQAHDDVGLRLLSGPLQLLGGGALGQEVVDDPADGRQGLGLRLLVQGRVDTEDPRLRVARAVGVDGVAKPLLLPHLLKQPGGHAAAQDRRQELQGKALGGVVVQPRKGQGQVILLDGLGGGDKGRGIRRRDRGRCPTRRQGGKTTPNVLQDFLGKAAREGHNGVVPPVVGVVIGLEKRPRHGGQGLLPAQNGPGQRAAGKDGPEKLFGAEVVRGVLIHVDLF